MSLKNKKKVYLSFSNELLEFLDKKAKMMNLTRTQLVNNIIKNEYEKNKKDLIQKVIEGKK